MSKIIIEPSELIKKIKSKFNKNDLIGITVVMILGLINNFYFIIGECIAPDALSTSDFVIASNLEVSLGRFE